MRRGNVSKENVLHFAHVECKCELYRLSVFITAVIPLALRVLRKGMTMSYSAMDVIQITFASPILLRKTSPGYPPSNCNECANRNFSAKYSMAKISRNK